MEATPMIVRVTRGQVAALKVGCAKLLKRLSQGFLIPCFKC
jgi:hypothetical protein